MSESDLAQMLDVTTRTIRRWRREGTGPIYIKPSDRVIRYHERDVDRWINEHRSKSDGGAEQES